VRQASASDRSRSTRPTLHALIQKIFPVARGNIREKPGIAEKPSITYVLTAPVNEKLRNKKLVRMHVALGKLATSATCLIIKHLTGNTIGNMSATSSYIVAAQHLNWQQTGNIGYAPDLR
jgi:hypothetical protein